MLFYFYIFIFLVAIVSLGVSSGMVARALLKLGRIVGLNECVLSFMLLGIITSLPEIFIATASVITNNPLLSIGNIIGANFTNITLAIGLVAYLSGGIDLSGQVSKRVFWISFMLVLMPSFLVLGGGLSRFDGLLLCLMFLAYIIVFSYDGQFLEKSAPHVPYGVHYFSEVYPSLINLTLGLLILVLSSIFIILFTAGLTSYWPIDLILFSTVVLGLATTLPELFFGMRGAIMQHSSLAMGNILASTVFNSTVIIGLLAIVSPTATNSLTAGPVILTSSFTFLAFILLSVFSYTGSRINRTEGVLLMSLYFLFITSASALYL
ncbi:MAG: hypothetical protein Q7S19_03280 [bacterium]|nr:hypothetical protein [bacterium]